MVRFSIKVELDNFAQLKPAQLLGNTMAEGTIKRLTDKGFGFIDVGTNKDLFFHSSSVEGTTYNELREGQRVTFNEAQGQKGPCAENVQLANE